jgi:hypothetical protein
MSDDESIGRLLRETAPNAYCLHCLAQASPLTADLRNCVGCGEGIGLNDHAFKVLLQRAIILQFHDECFDVYNRSPTLPK